MSIEFGTYKGLEKLSEFSALLTCDDRELAEKYIRSAHQESDSLYIYAALGLIGITKVKFSQVIKAELGDINKLDLMSVKSDLTKMPTTVSTNVGAFKYVTVRLIASNELPVSFFVTLPHVQSQHNHYGLEEVTKELLSQKRDELSLLTTLMENKYNHMVSIQLNDL